MFRTDPAKTDEKIKQKNREIPTKYGVPGSFYYFLKKSIDNKIDLMYSNPIKSI